ncbi:MAG: DUF432 domain-containing protein [Calditrichaeota bacterium]|nr:MAG: DUF432 domain-containing protein [Calditrichota bacterium]MBL1203926.1 DUF432 domain-containing protein [Calditrichota bacterium]NOG43759.1 DUF432 domain-containing protein [Calditrichota bacterium]
MKKQNQPIWDKYPLSGIKIKKITIADLVLYIQLLKNEIKIAAYYTTDKKNPDNNIEENLDWKRWPISKEITAVQIDPVFPDLSILVKPESSFNLAINSESNVFVRFPISIKISAISEKETYQLMEIPSVKLSNTWFGTFTEGEKCYSISSGFRTEIETDDSRQFMVICPIKLKNKSKEDLLVDKICLRTEYISLFMDQTQLWTDDISITYFGKNEISLVNFTSKKPHILPEASLLTKPRSVTKKSISARSFSSIKDLAGPNVFVGK